MLKKLGLAMCVAVASVFTVAVSCGQETSGEQAKAAAESVLWFQDLNQQSDAVQTGDALVQLRWVAGDEPGVYSIQAVAEKPSPFLIGVQCEPAGETSFMSQDVGGMITVQGGLKISQISKDSPAEKIGMQVDDIILTVDGNTVTNINDLVSIVTEKGESEIHGTLIRDHKAVEFDVTPVKRPEEEEQAAKPNQFTFNRKLNWYMPNPVALPEGYLVTIDVQNGSQPTITLKKGDRIWTTTDGGFAKLPKDTKLFARAATDALSPLVNRKVGWVNKNFDYNNSIHFANTSQGYVPAVIAARSAADEKEVARKLDELQQQLTELTRIVGELKKNRD